MFDNPRYLSAGVAASVPIPMQLFLWQCIDSLPQERDYLQVFRLEPFGGMQQVRHASEQPKLSQLYIFPADAPIHAKIFVVDSDDHSTMILAEEY